MRRTLWYAASCENERESVTSGVFRSLAGKPGELILRDSIGLNKSICLDDGPPDYQLCRLDFVFSCGVDWTTLIDICCSITECLLWGHLLSSSWAVLTPAVGTHGYHQLIVLVLSAEAMTATILQAPLLNRSVSRNACLSLPLDTSFHSKLFTGFLLWGL